MSLRYLDINPTPISEEGIYSNAIVVAGSTVIEYKFNEGKIDVFVNNESQGSISCETLSNGYIYALFCDFPIFYNDINKRYTNMTRQEIDYAYSNDFLFTINKGDREIEIIDVDNFNIWENIDYFSSSVFLTTEEWRYIGKKNNKIAIMITTKSGSEVIEYNGNKLVNLEGKDISFIMDEVGDVYAIFKVGVNLYRYNFQDDFIDNNIILWGILPKDIENFSIGAKGIVQQEYQEFYLFDFVNHKYYTATLTDTPPAEDGNLVTFKKEDGTTKSYNVVKFVKKDGTSKTYTKVRFNKFNGGN